MQAPSVLVIAAEEDRPSVEPLLEALASRGTIVDRQGSSAAAALLVASPSAARSTAVDDALTAWVDDHGVESLLVVLVDGELHWNNAADAFELGSTTALSAAGQARFATRPLWLDARAGFTPPLVSRILAGLAPAPIAPAALPAPAPAALTTPPAPPAPGAASPIFAAHPTASPPRARRTRWPIVLALALLPVLLLAVLAALLLRSGGSEPASEPATTIVSPSSAPAATPPGSTAPPPTAPDQPTTVPASGGGSSWVAPVLLLVAGLGVGVGVGLVLAWRHRASPAPVTKPAMAPPAALGLVEPAAAVALTDQVSPEASRGAVFISHSFDTDHDLALRLAQDLRPRLDVWLAPESIEPGDSWLTAVERGLSTSGVFLALLSEASLSSPWVLKEIQAAMELEVEQRLRLLPVQIEQCQLPILLRTYQVLQLSAGYGQIVDKTMRLAGVR